MMMILWIVSSLFVIGYGQDVDFSIASCGSVGENMTMTAVYTGSGTVTEVEWFYSGAGSNLAVDVTTCTVFGLIPTGYPETSRMSYECPATDSLPANTFKLTVTGLQEDELNNRWGATFSVSGVATLDVRNSTVTECTNGGGSGDDGLEWKIVLICLGGLCGLFLIGILIGGILLHFSTARWEGYWAPERKPLRIICCVLVVGLGLLLVHSLHNAKTENDHPLTEKGPPSATNGTMQPTPQPAPTGALMNGSERDTRLESIPAKEP